LFFMARQLLVVVMFCSVDRSSRHNRVKKNQLDAQLSIFCQPLCVSGVSRPIIRRYNRMYTTIGSNSYSFLLPLALQPAVGFDMSNNTSPFFPIYHQPSPSSHSQHLKISFYFFSPSFPGSSSSSRPFQFLSEDFFGHPILLHSLQVTQPTYPLPLYPFYYIFSFIQLF